MTATADIWTQIAALSPKLFLKMQDASGNLADASGNSHTATAVGSATYHATGPDAVNVPFGITVAAGQYFTIAHHADFNWAANGTALLLYKRASATTDAYMFGKTDATLAAPGYSATIHNVGPPDVVNLQNGATSTQETTTAAIVDDTNWHLIGLDKPTGSTDGHIYVDGVSVGINSSALTFTDNALGLAICNLYSGGGFVSAGTYALFAMWQSILTAQNHADLYGGIAFRPRSNIDQLGMLGFFGI